MRIKVAIVLLLLLLAGWIASAQTFIGRPMRPLSSSDPCSPSFNTSSLNTGLVSYWKLDEASGTRADVQNTNNLTTVTSVVGTGKISNCISNFTGGHAFAASINTLNLTNTSFTVAGWVTRNQIAINGVYVTAGDGAPWQVIMNGDTFLFFVQSTNAVNTSVSTNVNPTVDVFYFFAATYIYNGTAAAGNLKIQINDGTIINGSTALANSQLKPGTATFGLLGYVSTSAFDARGKIDELGVWNRALTTDELSALYNCGNGRTTPF